MSHMNERTRPRSANMLPIRNAWTSSVDSSKRLGLHVSGTGTIGSSNQGTSNAFGSMRCPTPPSERRRGGLPPRRSLSAESLSVSVIPKVLSIESEFQAILGKTLFEKTVNVAEDDLMTKGDSVIKWSDRPASRSADNSPAASLRSGPPVFEYRTAVSLKPTLCTSPLVKHNQTFVSYFPKGSLDTHAVAQSRGYVDGPHPNITRQVHRIRSASNINLRSFSLKPDLTDRKKETLRESYWKRRAELKVLEECIKYDVIDEVMALADAEIARREEARAVARRAELERLAEIERIELEKKRLEAERLAKLTENGAQTVITYIEDMKNAEKAPVKSKKKGKKGRKKSSSPSRGGAKSSKTVKKKKKAPSGADNDESTLPKKTPTSILKAEDRVGSASSLGTGSDDSAKKRVSFRKKLTSTRTIRSNSPPKSTKRSNSPTPGGGKKRTGGAKRGKGKKGKTKVAQAPIPVEPVTPVAPPPPEQSPEPVPDENRVEDPIVIQLDDPPEFIPAEEYRTKNQLVQDWLTYKTCKTASKTLPLLIDL